MTPDDGVPPGGTSGGAGAGHVHGHSGGAPCAGLLDSAGSEGGDRRRLPILPRRGRQPGERSVVSSLRPRMKETQAASRERALDGMQGASRSRGGGTRDAPGSGSSNARAHAAGAGDASHPPEQRLETLAPPVRRCVIAISDNSKGSDDADGAAQRGGAHNGKRHGGHAPDGGGVPAAKRRRLEMAGPLIERPPARQRQRAWWPAMREVVVRDAAQACAVPDAAQLARRADVVRALERVRGGAAVVRGGEATARGSRSTGPSSFAPSAAVPVVPGRESWQPVLDSHTQWWHHPCEPQAPAAPLGATTRPPFPLIAPSILGRGPAAVQPQCPPPVNGADAGLLAGLLAAPGVLPPLGPGRGSSGALCADAWQVPSDAEPMALRTMTFNILSDSHAWHFERQLYSYAGGPADRARVLTWEARWALIAAKIWEHNPDIVALQEVDHARWAEVRHGLHSMGYDTHAGFKEKRSGALGDGAVIAWHHRLGCAGPPCLRTTRLSDAGGGPATKGAGRKGNGIHRPQVLVTAELVMWRNQRAFRLLVGSTHIIFDPTDGLGKRMQCDAVLQDVSSYLQTSAKENAGKGKGKGKGKARCPELTSAYVAAGGREPTYTTSHDRAHETVDYIWLHGATSTAALSPTATEERRCVGLPTLDHGSDHLPVVVDISIQPDAPAVAICGDFNITPCSPLYSYVASGGRYVPSMHRTNPAYIPPDRWSGLRDEPRHFAARGVGQDALLYGPSPRGYA